MDLIKIRRALISVSDKNGIAGFAEELQRFGVEIISTGGTLDALRKAGIAVIPVSEATGFPEILDGRVKTLHPNIHGGLLAVPDNPEHLNQLKEHNILPIDLIAVNLYPFEETIARTGVSLSQAIEQIDIGGPSMLRAAAKNYRYKIVVSDPGQYENIISEMKSNNGAVSEKTRFSLAKKVFLHTAMYDAAISNYLCGIKDDPSAVRLPETFTFTSPKSADLRYGENPHQHAALYGEFSLFFRKLHGKELSYNNIVDIQAAQELLEEFSGPAVVIIKHTNPCGVGTGKTLTEAYDKALATDSKSAFGGIVALNRVLGSDEAKEIDKVFTEVIIAPGYSDSALEFLMKKRDRRLMLMQKPVGSKSGFTIKRVAGGMLVQTSDDLLDVPENLKVVTRRSPTDEENASMAFGWKVAKHVKSNAIVYTRADRTIGIGAGQMSRFDSSRLAAMKAADAGLDLKGSAVASDAFFPFADGLLEAVRAGATAVIQPGGSVRDPEVIRAADDNNIAMIFTGIRHFRH